MSVGTYADFFAALRMRESSGHYEAVNPSDGSLGAYQFQEIALRDIGWYQADGTAANDYTTGWTATAHSHGVYSRADFINSPAAQDAAMTDWAAKLWGYINGEFGLTPYVGTFVNGVELTPTALIGGAHLVGINALADFIKSGGTHQHADPYGTTVTDYVKLFSPYASPYDAPATGGSTTPPTDVPTLPPTDVSSGDDQSSAGTYGDFFAALRMRESSDHYDAVNPRDGSLGAYQFQEIALRDIGWYQADGTAANDYTTGWTATAHSHGVYSRADFINSPAAQDAAMTDWAAKLWGYINGEFGLTPYVGTFVNGVELTPTALIGGAHLVGINALADYIRSGGANEHADPYGTTVTDYVKLFSPYTSPYDAPATGGSTTPPTNVPTLPPTDVPSVDQVLLADGSTIHDIHQTTRGKSLALSLDGHSEAGAKVAISEGSRIVGSAVADNDGNWDVDLPGARGVKQYAISITDPGSTDTTKTSLYVGSSGGDTITGTIANDVIVGGPGNDVIRGGGGSDTFVFNQRFGKDTIADFRSGDVLAFDKSIVSSAADVFKHASQVGADTLFVLGSDSALLKNVQVSNLHNEDFRFI